jgi:hypothetical protein
VQDFLKARPSFLAVEFFDHSFNLRHCVTVADDGVEHRRFLLALFGMAAREDAMYL